MKELENARELRASEKLILRLLHRGGSLNKAEIAEATGTSVSTIGRRLDGMVSSGILEQGEGTLPSAGRRPAVYTIKKSAFYSIGSYISWDSIGVGLMNARGEIEAKVERSFERGDTPHSVAAFIAATLRGLLQDRRVDPERVRGLGVAVPGPLLKRQGILFHSPHLPWPQWDMVPFRDLVGMQSGLEASVDTLAGTALRAEVLHGIAKDEPRPAFLLLDVGIGTATYLAGMTGFSDDDTSGSLGHMIVNIGGEECVCGNRGCLETFASIDSVIRKFRELVLGSDAADHIHMPPADDRSQYLRAMARVLESPDVDSARFTEAVGGALAVGINNFINLVNPSLVVVGGRLADELPGLTEWAFNRAVELSFLGRFKEVRFVRRSFGGDTLIRGSAYQVIDSRLGLTNPSRM